MTENENEKFCPNCGAKCGNDDTFCSECGNKIVESENKNSDTENKPAQNLTDNSSTNKTCPYCYSELPQSAVKCPNCGEWLTKKKENVSHFGCGGFLMICTLITCLPMLIGGFTFDDIPFLGALGAGASIGLFIFVLIYLFPSLLAESRGHDSKFGIFLVNLFFGWSLIGWIIALILAFQGKRR